MRHTAYNRHTYTVSKIIEIIILVETMNFNICIIHIMNICWWNFSERSSRSNDVLGGKCKGKSLKSGHWDWSLDKLVHFWYDFINKSYPLDQGRRFFDRLEKQPTIGDFLPFVLNEGIFFFKNHCWMWSFIGFCSCLIF